MTGGLIRTRSARAWLSIGSAMLWLTACSSGGQAETARPSSPDAGEPVDRPVNSAAATTELAVPASVAHLPASEPAATPVFNTTADAATTLPTTVPLTVPITVPLTVPLTVPVSVPITVPITVPVTVPPPSLTSVGVAIPALGSGTTSYLVPTSDVQGASWADTHTGYPASDIFVPGDNGCGGEVVAPVNGVVTEVRADNLYDRTTDNPALRGGRSVTIVGDDGVRYYLAHFAAVDGAVVPGSRVAAGQLLGVIGDSGRTSACHVHFAISPPCANREWSVRRGVVWPYPYLEAWRHGEQLSPVEEVEAWAAANPQACAAAAVDPNAGDS